MAGLNADKILEGDTSVEAIDSGSDGNIQFKLTLDFDFKLMKTVIQYWWNA